MNHNIALETQKIQIDRYKYTSLTKCFKAIRHMRMFRLSNLVIPIVPLPKLALSNDEVTLNDSFLNCHIPREPTSEFQQLDFSEI